MEDGIDPREILLMTFTDNAAAELRMRVFHRLLKARHRAEAAADDELTMRAISASSQLVSAPISTIHSFCTRLLREHALEVCSLAGARERVDFHATSMETLRQMVAADMGLTLMPVLAVKAPIAPTGNMVLKRFQDPEPNRTIALVWRGSSALGPFLQELAGSLQPPAASLLPG